MGNHKENLYVLVCFERVLIFASFLRVKVMVEWCLVEREHSKSEVPSGRKLVLNVKHSNSNILVYTIMQKMFNILSMI